MQDYSYYTLNLCVLIMYPWTIIYMRCYSHCSKCVWKYFYISVRKCMFIFLKYCQWQNWFNNATNSVSTWVEITFKGVTRRWQSHMNFGCLKCWLLKIVLFWLVLWDDTYYLLSCLCGHNCHLEVCDPPSKTKLPHLYFAFCFVFIICISPLLLIFHRLQFG